MTLQLSVLPSLGDDTDNPVMITLGLPSTTNRSVHCGQQAPEIGPTELTTLNGSDDDAQYHFSATYDRTVILREDQLGQDKSSSPPMSGQPTHTTFLPGQSLWRCTFNDTLLEGFIYRGKEDGSASNATNVQSGVGAHLPYKLEFLEHRVPTGSAPYCEKVVVSLDRGLEDSGESVDLKLDDASSGSNLDKDNADNSCQCQWMVE